MTIIYIYGLFDPRNLQLRYIGKSNNPKLRYSAHISEAKKFNTRKDTWIKQLLNENLTPSIEILEECTEDNWQEIEIAWIKEGKEKGLNLVNMSEGGNGFQCGELNPNYGKFGKEHHSYGRKPSEKTRKKISEGNKGKINTTKQRLAASITHKGRKRANWERKKISEGRMGCKVKPFSDEHKRKISEALKGKTYPPHSEFTKKKRTLSRQMTYAERDNDTKLLINLQKQYLELVGEYHPNHDH